MALSNEKQRRFVYSPDKVIKYPVKGSTTIYAGAHVSIASGYARGLNVADTYGGVALETVVNSGADGAKEITLILEGIIVGVSATGISAITGVGTAINATGDDTLVVTTTNSLSIGGKVTKFKSATDIDVSFKSGLI